MVYPISFDSPERVKKVSDLACNEPYEIWVSCENNMLNAKSLLGLYSLVGKDVLVVAEDNANPERFLRVVRKMVA